MLKLKEQKMKKEAKKMKKVKKEEKVNRKPKQDRTFVEDKEVLEFRKEYEKSMRQPVRTRRNPSELPKSQRGRRRKTAE